MYDIMLLGGCFTFFCLAFFDTGCIRYWISEEASAGMSGCGVPAITPIGTRGDIFKDSCVVDNLLFASAYSTMSSSA